MNLTRDRAPVRAENRFGIRTQVLAAMLLVGFVAWSEAPAQDALTAAQLRWLESLSEEQREAMLEQLDLDAAESTDDELEFPETMTHESDEELEEEEDDILRVEGGTTIVITMDLREDLERPDMLEITDDSNRARLQGQNVYQVNSSGILVLPGVADVPLAGLSADEVALRLMSEPELRQFNIYAQILPLVPTGMAALEPFGYDLFNGVPTTFAPATDIPVPANYMVGPGDEVRIQLFGNQNAQYDLVVSREGFLNFPEIGPIEVSGMSFGNLREELMRRIESQLIGTQASITMGELRSIQVFVLGDVEKPGSYTVSGLTTMTNALLASGGVKPIGSLRRIQLKRGGELVTRLDLYSLLQRGDTSGDERLQPGDVIFVPPVGPRAGIGGEVLRPGIYEIWQERTLEDLVRLAGGLTPDADISRARLESVSSSGRRAVRTVSLDGQDAKGTRLRPGDVLEVSPIIDKLVDTIELAGHVTSPGRYGWRTGMRITDLIQSEADLQPQADMGYVLIRREVRGGQGVEVRSADISKALDARGSDQDVSLAAGDSVTVFALGETRGAEMRRLLADLEAQATSNDPYPAVSIGGQVKSEGTYPLESGMRISDLLRAGGGLSSAAYTSDAELTRFEVSASGERTTRMIRVDLASVLSGDSIADVALKPYDYLNIKEIPEWRDRLEIEVRGEVRFPGVYPVKRGEYLSSVIARAGGLTDLAFAQGALFTRESLAERESQQIDGLVARLEGDLRALALQSSSERGISVEQTVNVGRQLLDELRETEPVGRLVIDLMRVIERPGDRDFDIVVKDGDRLFVPNLSQEVTVLGEVQYASSHRYAPELGRDGYVQLSGGLTGNADDKRIYVVRADGSVVTGNSGSRWFRRGEHVTIHPGDTIVVPLDTDRMSPLATWGSVTQIIYNLAIAVAAVNSF